MSVEPQFKCIHTLLHDPTECTYNMPLQTLPFCSIRSDWYFVSIFPIYFSPLPRHPHLSLGIKALGSWVISEEVCLGKEYNTVTTFLWILMKALFQLCSSVDL